jgi:hypothetical protein
VIGVVDENEIDRKVTAFLNTTLCVADGVICEGQDQTVESLLRFSETTMDALMSAFTTEFGGTVISRPVMVRDLFVAAQASARRRPGTPAEIEARVMDLIAREAWETDPSGDASVSYICDDRRSTIETLMTAYFSEFEVDASTFVYETTFPERSSWPFSKQPTQLIVRDLIDAAISKRLTFTPAKVAAL